MKILGGGFLTREDFSKLFPFMVYLTVLLMLIITNAYIAENANRTIINNNKLLDNLRVEYNCAQSAFTKESTQSVMIDKLAQDGIKESFETRIVRNEN